MQRLVVTPDHAGDTRQRLAFRLSLEPQMELGALLKMPHSGEQGSILRAVSIHTGDGRCWFANSGDNAASRLLNGIPVAQHHTAHAQTDETCAPGPPVTVQ